MVRQIASCIMLGGILLVSGASAALARDYQIGDKVEAYIRFTWHKATIVKPVTASKFTDFEVAIERDDARTGRGISNFDVSKDDLRPRGESERLAARPAKAGEGPRLGKYGMYGAMSNTLGHFVLMPQGRYKVSRSSEEKYFGDGTYAFDAKTSTINWLSGPFQRNAWGGKFEVKEGGKVHRIEFNRTTFGGNYGK